MTTRRHTNLCSVTLALALGWAMPAHATTIPVTTLADGSVAGFCSLRDAITAAEFDTGMSACPAGSGADTITFTVSGTITLDSTLVVSTTITIDGSGQRITVSGGNAVRVFINTLGATLRLQNLTVANGFADGKGAGIFNSGNLTVSNCTFSGNNTTSRVLSGGAIANASTIANTATLTVTNSTFAENSAYVGGAVFNLQLASISHSTFSGNSAPGGGGAINNHGTLSLANTILANSTSGGDCYNEHVINPSGVNLVMDGSCSIAGALSGDPMLGSLTDNGGPTRTFALRAGSPAIDSANDTICAAAGSFDQRGIYRPADGDGDGVAHCDIGAYELEAVPFSFTGFFSPVDNLPVVNLAKAGSSIPVKFSLGGNRGLNIFAVNSPRSAAMACPSGAPSDPIDLTVAAGGSLLTYDASTDQYSYAWKTNKAWAGSCRQFILELNDGSVQTASFQFK